MMKKVRFAILLIFVLCLGMAAASAAEPITSGSCGTNVNWQLDMYGGVLTIFGSGAMNNYGEEDPSPWSQYRNQIARVVVEAGVTSIGDYAFVSCTALTNVLIPESVTSIGINAFYGCSSLESVTIPDSVTSIGDRAFMNCSNLGEVICRGTSAPASGENVFDNARSPLLIYVLDTYEDLEFCGYPILKGKSDGMPAAPRVDDLPQTGDSSKPMLWLTMSILSVLGILLLQKNAYSK